MKFWSRKGLDLLDNVDLRTESQNLIHANLSILTHAK